MQIINSIENITAQAKKIGVSPIVLAGNRMSVYKDSYSQLRVGSDDGVDDLVAEFFVLEMGMLQEVIIELEEELLAYFGA